MCTIQLWFDSETRPDFVVPPNMRVWWSCNDNGGAWILFCRSVWLEMGKETVWWEGGGLCECKRLTVRKVPNGMGVGGTEGEVVRWGV
jgi:hypothetical protein